MLSGLFAKRQGDTVTREEVLELAKVLTQALEMAAGLREPGPLLDTLTTPGTEFPAVEAPLVLSFSGGVADCIETEQPWLAFGDMGPELGKAIRESRLCTGEYVLGTETIRATVIGAGSHSAQLSGSTVFYQNIRFPLKNLPVVPFGDRVPMDAQDTPWVVALPGIPSPSYGQVAALAEKLLETLTPPLVLALEADMAKALGTQLALGLGKDAPILCIDRVKLEAGSYLDVGAPVGPALPVVVKTLVLNR